MINRIFFIVIIVILNSCLPGFKSSLVKSKGLNGKTPGTPGLDFCTHRDARNHTANIQRQVMENCEFVTCMNPLKLGYNFSKVIEYQDHIVSKGGVIINDEVICGDNNNDGDDDTQFPGEYHTYKEVVDIIKNETAKYPDYASLHYLGQTHNSRTLLGTKITDKNSNLEKSTFLIMGTHHAREHLSTEVPLNLIKYFLEETRSNPVLKEMLKTREIYIFPLINPDGALYDRQGDNFISWRKNTRPLLNSANRGVDLNRNYELVWGTGGASPNTGSDTYRGPEPFSENETKAIKAFVEANKSIRTIITFHAFSELILYPWGGKAGAVPGRDGEVFLKMAQDLANMTGYAPIQASSLYVANGDTCDWAYSNFKIFCMTVELTPSAQGGGGFYPPASVIQPTFEKMKEPMMYMLEHTVDPYEVLK